MRRTLAAAAVLATACAIGVAAPAGSAPTGAQAAAKHRCKHRHHHRKRCPRRETTGSGTTTGTATAGGGGSTGITGRVLATEREVSASQLQLQLSRPSVPAGSTIVEQYNAGQDAHNLVVQNGDASVVFAYPTLDPGGDQKQTLPLTHGTYTLYCSLLNHRSLGMEATLTVN